MKHGITLRSRTRLWLQRSRGICVVESLVAIDAAVARGAPDRFRTGTLMCLSERRLSFKESLLFMELALRKIAQHRLRVLIKRLPLMLKPIPFGLCSICRAANTARECLMHSPRRLVDGCRADHQSLVADIRDSKPGLQQFADARDVLSSRLVGPRTEIVRRRRVYRLR